MNQAKRQPAPVKRAHIVDVAMRHFAEHGYEDARTEDIARDACTNMIGVGQDRTIAHRRLANALAVAEWVRSTYNYSVALCRNPNFSSK